MKPLFVATTLVQLFLGIWRARVVDSSLLPALALAALIAAVGWLSVMSAGPLRRFAALLAATAGVLSAISAANAPLIGNVARISTPLFALSIAAVLMAAGQGRRLQIAAGIVFVIALAVLEYDLTRDAVWESEIQNLKSGEIMDYKVVGDVRQALQIDLRQGEEVLAEAGSMRRGASHSVPRRPQRNATYF